MCCGFKILQRLRCAPQFRPNGQKARISVLHAKNVLRLIYIALFSYDVPTTVTMCRLSDKIQKIQEQDKYNRSYFANICFGGTDRL